MNDICGLCNGLVKYDFYCYSCDRPMLDGGKVSDYYDSYAASIPMDLVASATENGDICTHLYYCPHCGNDFHHTETKKSY